MFTTEENKLIYKSAYQFLLSLLPEGINEDSLNKYFECESSDFISLEEYLRDLLFQHKIIKLCQI